MRKIGKPDTKSRKYRSGVVLAALTATALALTGCQFNGTQYNSVGDILFAPTYDPTYVPQTYGTRYDCKAFQAAGNSSGWRGTVAGTVNDFERTIRRSRVGCFPTRDECSRFLLYMSGFYTQTYHTRCDPIG